MHADHDPVRAVLEEAIGRGMTPAAAWWAGRRSVGALTRGAIGWAVVDPVREPVAEETPFDLASLTKPLATAVLAARLATEGIVDLDGPALSWLPELAASAYEKVTLDDLGAHRAGLPAWAPLYLEGSTREDYARAIARRAPAVEPGATLYSDLGYILLGIALERAAGLPLDRLFDDRIASPLGLERTGYAARGGRFGRAAATERGNAYERRMAGEEGRNFAFRERVLRGEVHDVNAWALGGVAGHAGLFGTAAEAAAVALALLDGGALGLGAAVRARILTAPATRGARTFGLQRSCDAESVHGVLSKDAVGHFGFTGTSLWIDPAAGSVFVLLTNRVHPVVPEEAFVDLRRRFHEAALRLVIASGIP